MTISATHFKARCLELMNQVGRTGKPVTITKHGKPVARLFPPAAVKTKAVPGPMAMLGYGRKFGPPAMSSDEWMKLLREGEQD